ncbi:peptidase family M48-domain-containing protein [Scheffersomyces amazonensis]|uniref:peptidase family M48-domain-containing protein n=1 Tax=Scheffersomyces amazonensis TaxID=1078765 RepID=UPI00315DEDAD
MSYLDNDSIPWKLITSSILICKFVFDNYSEIHRYKLLNNPTPPKILKSEPIVNLYECHRLEARLDLITNFVKNLNKCILSCLSISINVLYYLWVISGFILSKFSWALPTVSTNSLVVRCLVFYCIQRLGSDLESFRLDCIYTFLSELGMNKYKWKSWLRDKILSLVISDSLSAILTLSLGVIIDYCGDNYVIYGTSFVTVYIIFIYSITPSLIDPLFFKFNHLEQGNLRNEIIKLAAKHGFSSRDIYVIDSSKKTSRQNAYITGLPWNRKIVLFDSLIKTSSNKEVLANMAQLFGHYKHGHINKLVLLAIADSVLYICLSTGFVKNKSLLKAFGFDSDAPGLVGYILFHNLFSFYRILSRHITKQLVTRFENFAKKHAEDLGYYCFFRTASIKSLGLDLYSKESDWLHATYFKNHISLMEQLVGIEILLDLLKRNELN